MYCVGSIYYFYTLFSYLNQNSYIYYACNWTWNCNMGSKYNIVIYKPMTINAESQLCTFHWYNTSPMPVTWLAAILIVILWAEITGNCQHLTLKWMEVLFGSKLIWGRKTCSFWCCQLSSVKMFLTKIVVTIIFFIIFYAWKL
jgi:hypothetical protein